MNSYDLDFKPLSKYGEHFTIEDFADSVRDGMFTDDDGFGCYATSTEQVNVPVRLKDIARGIWDNRFTHVVWFNK